MAPDNDNIQEYCHGAKRTNNPPAGLASHVDDEKQEKLYYRFDPHLPPKLRFDQTGEADELPDGLPELLQKATEEGLTDGEAQTIADALQRKQQPWLEWTDKRQKHDAEVDPVALHTHERVSAQAIVKALEKEDVQRDLFADPQLPYHEAVQFYQHDVDWTNRLILGDSLEVMASLAHRENLAGQVQMIYLDPPYGISYKSNFQPEVGNRSFRETYSNLSREPEVVKAYRDTWKLGVHSYLDYLRDRLVLCHNMLTDTGSLFLQISDANIHRVRCVLDEVFGGDNFVSIIAYKKSAPRTSTIKNTVNYLLWYSKNKKNVKANKLYKIREANTGSTSNPKKLALWAEFPNGNRRPLTTDEKRHPDLVPDSARIYRVDKITYKGESEKTFPFEFEGDEIGPKKGYAWRGYPDEMERLKKANRIQETKTSIGYKFYLDDYPLVEVTNFWDDTAGKVPNMNYVVQTHHKIVQRCILMTTDPGDIVLDPTCGGGTTPYTAEKWGRRWIGIDTSRVSLALSKQRILTSVYPFFRVRSEEEGKNDPSEGLVHKTAPHVKMSSIKNNQALDSILEKHDSKLERHLRSVNQALGKVNDEKRLELKSKLRQKKKKGDRSISDADVRRWLLPADGQLWEHWEVPFDTDPDWPEELQNAVEAYRNAWREKMDEVNDAIAEGSEQEVLYDQPEVVKGVTRVSGPFTVEAVMPPERSLNGSSFGGQASGDDDVSETNDVSEGRFTGREAWPIHKPITVPI